VAVGTANSDTLDTQGIGGKTPAAEATFRRCVILLRYISPLPRIVMDWHKKNIPSGGVTVKGIVEERCVELGSYIVENQATVRAAAKKFGISKSTVHMDVSERLRNVQPQLYCQVRQVLDTNKSQRHIRGGLATREKYRMEEE